MADKKFEAQVNYGWGLTLNMTGKAPAVANRIFPTYKDALDYINDYNNSAVEGLTLSVVNDTDELNGSYFVEKVGTLGDNNTYNNDGVLRKLVDSEDLNDIKQELDLFTIKKGSGPNSSLQVNAPGSDASGTNSLAVGMDAVASGYYSVAMGRSCSATGRSSIALGGIVWIIRLTGEPNAVTYQTNIAYVKLAKYIVGLKLVDASDYTIHVATIIATNVVDDTAFITVDKTLSESALSSEPYRLLGCNASGNSSIALAGCIKALGNNSTAEGYYTVAAGNYSHAEGHRSISSGVTSHAEGRETEASADYSHAEGYSTMAEATASHAEGGATLASGDAAHAEGYGTVAAGNYSHAEGIGTIASGRDSHAEGYYTIATGKRSHAEGYAMHNIYLTGSNSTYQIRYGSNILNTFHFIRRCQGASILEITNFTKIATITSVNISDDGYTVTITTDTDLGELSNYKCSALVVIASGEASHTENSALSSGTDSHAGGWSLATNYYSFSHGCDCTADGETSTSFGTNTYSQNNSEFALGRSNHSHTGETLAELTLFSVGCGDFEEIDMSKRIEQQLPLPTPEDGTNALEIMLNGDIWLGGYEEGVKLFEGETKELNTYTKEELDIELDSKIESDDIVNDLTTGGDDKVLSAEMGKSLNQSKQNKLDNYRENPSNGSVEIFAQDIVSIQNDSQGGVSCVEVYNEEDTEEGLIPVARMSAEKENGDYANVTVRGNEVHIDGDAVKVNGEDLENFRTTIVNDLTMGGADKALSAEMGKLLETSVTELSSDLDSKAPLEGYAPNLKVRFSDGLVGRIETIPRDIGRISPTADISVDDNSATIERIKGESIVWNQCNKGLSSSANTYGGLVFTYDNENHILTINGTASQTWYSAVFEGSTQTNHRYFILGEKISGNYTPVSDDTFFINDGYTQFRLSPEVQNKMITEPITIDRKHIGIRCIVGDVFDNYKIQFVFHDLTLMFGAGNEPTTIEEFEARKPLGVSNKYNEGTIVSFLGGDVKSVGFNAWDGVKAEVIGGQKYYLGGTYTSIGFSKEIDGELTSIVVPSDKIYTPSEDGYIYAQGTDICIHLVHSGYRNGDYEPYVDDIHPLPDIKSIKDSNDDTLFPYGLLSAGSIHDEITATKAVKRVGVIILTGEEAWSLQSINSNGIANFNTPLIYNTNNNHLCDRFSYDTRSIASVIREGFHLGGGATLYIRINASTADTSTKFKEWLKNNHTTVCYELAEPIEVDLPEPLNMIYKAWDFGTEELIVSEPSTSLKGEVIYHFNAVDRIRENSRNIIIESERAKLAEKTNSDALAAETAAREAADQAINDTIGTVTEGKTVVEMIEDAQAAAEAAATVVTEDSEFITIEQTGEIGKTYTIKTQDIASSGDLAAEISRAQEAEQANTDAIDSIKSDYLKSSDKLELSQAIVAETEARVLAISNLEFKNSLKLDGVVLSEELLDTLSDVQSGALYSVGPDSNDQYKLYAYVNNSWTYMGYLNSSSIDITQSLGLSLNLAISQKAVTDALTPIIMTLAEFDALVSNGTITDDDLTIRYIID